MKKATTTKSGNFLGDTKGNRDMNHNLTQMNLGGSGESHTFNTGQYGGAPTKGNRDLPINRTTGAK